MNTKTEADIPSTHDEAHLAKTTNVNNTRMAPQLHPDVRIGHIHLKVSDIDRSIKFYRDVLGFDIQSKLPGAVFLSAGGYHHHIGINIWAGKDAKKPAPNTTGLYHFAILYPTRQELAKALQRLLDNNYPIDGFADHGVSEAIYLEDPDGNGIELYWDKPRKDWPKDISGNLEMYTKNLDIDSLLKENVKNNEI